MKKKCIICGFDKKTHEHHILKKIDEGSDEEENIVTLCLNHHWVSDFGTSKERKEILIQIIKITGKVGKKITQEESDLLHKKVMVLAKEFWGEMNNEFKNQYKGSSNYENTKSWLLGMQCPPTYSRQLNERAERLLMINN